MCSCKCFKPVASLEVAPAEAAEECGQCSGGMWNSSLEHRPQNLRRTGQ